MLALRSMTAPRARVLRDGHSVMIAADRRSSRRSARARGGRLVAADARLLEAHALTTNEAPLTGESTPVEKHDRRRRHQTPAGRAA